ncbi:DUF4097 family beta strand repeat-containing protein [Streptomyces lavendulae]|uniref:DUF4097 family beta strand repeat-containing protein n=1 Tax=Streptomyces lavendulae TaxID=1914 RepID=UPI0036C27D9D
MEPTTRTLLAFGGAALLVLAATACTTDGASAAATVESKSFDFAGGSLTVTSGSADLALVAADIEGVQVERRVTGRKVGGEVGSGWQLEGGTLTLSLDCTGISLDCGAKYTVKVPRAVAVTAESGKGRIEATGFTADFSARTADGDVRLSDLHGAELALEGGDGSIEGDGISARSVSVTSHNGNVDLGLAAVPDLVDVQSRDGNVELGLPESTYAVRTAAKKGDVTVNVAKDDGSGHSVAVRTRNGSIAIGKGGKS